MNVLLSDPSLFTAAYDAALTHGLLAAGVRPVWATRPLRKGDREEIPAACTDPFFYRHTDRADRLPSGVRLALKACAHVLGTFRLAWKVRRRRPDVVHVQWLVMPLVDLVGMALIRRWCPLVITVHDTVPHNGQKLAWPQRLGYDWSVKLAHHVIVHTRAGREAMMRRGVPAHRLSVIPHGPLALRVGAAPPLARDARWTAVLFGEIKPYKGLDVLIDAVAALPLASRGQLRVIVAGRPRMDMASHLARIAARGLAPQFDLRLGRLTEEEMAALFAEADGFVFPYRQIDASGVYYLVSGLGKWLIASRVGIFAETDLEAAGQGALVAPEDAAALARALAHAVEARPRAQTGSAAHSWTEIALATRALYERVRREFDARLAHPRRVLQR